MYQITILPKVLDALEFLDKLTATRILDSLSWLSENFDNISLRAPQEGKYFEEKEVRVYYKLANNEGGRNDLPNSD